MLKVLAILSLSAVATCYGLAVADEPAGQIRVVATPPPLKGSPEWSDPFAWLAPAGLPNDAPSPVTTPYEANPETRAAYIRSFRVAQIIGMVEIDNPSWTPNGPPTSPSDHGTKDGYAFGKALAQKRDLANSIRQQGFREAEYGGRQVTEQSPPAERKILEELREFAKAFERELRNAFPPDVTIEVTGTVRLYSQIYDDYSVDNTGVPRRAHQYVADFNGPEPFRHDWMFARPKGAEPDARSPDVGDWNGSYGFVFDRDATSGKWSLKTCHPRHQPGESGFFHQQRPKRQNDAWALNESGVARAAVEAAILRAQGLEPQPTTKPATTKPN